MPILHHKQTIYSSALDIPLCIGNRCLSIVGLCEISVLCSACRHDKFSVLCPACRHDRFSVLCPACRHDRFSVLCSACRHDRFSVLCSACRHDRFSVLCSACRHDRFIIETETRTVIRPFPTHSQIVSLRELPAIIFRNWVHFKQI